MKHVAILTSLIKSLYKSSALHLLIVVGPPGFAKSTIIAKALRELNIPFVETGSYSTPLNFYNSLGDKADATHVLDDCTGLFNEKKATAILKNATYPSAESIDGVGRILRWGSTSPLVRHKSINFTGKIIASANAIPKTTEMESLLSRGLRYLLEIDKAEIIELLEIAASSEEYFPNQKIVEDVLAFINDHTDHVELSKLNIRTLKQGYELATLDSVNWKSLFLATIPKQSPKEIVNQLSRSGAPIAQQLKEFMRLTAKSRRTFFNYRKELDLSGDDQGVNDEVPNRRTKNVNGGKYVKQLQN